MSSVDMVFSRDNLAYTAQSRRNPPSEESQNKRSQAQTPISEIRYDFSNPPDRFEQFSLRYDPNYEPSTDRKIGNPLYGAYVTNENGEMAWQSAKDIYELYGGIDGLHEYYTDENGNIDEDAKKTLDTIKEVAAEKKGIRAVIERLAAKAGVASGDVSKLKIDVDESGKILVGGLANTKLTKKIQEALSEETGFAARLKAYQGKEEGLYKGMQDSMALFEGTNQNRPEEPLRGLDVLESIVKATREQGLDIEDIDGISTLGDPMGFAYLELFRDDTISADFSHKDKGLEDPGATIHSELGSVVIDIRFELDRINLENRRASTDNTQPPEETVSMDNIKITLNENGEIAIEGNFAQSAGMDSEARTRVNKIIQDKLGGLTEGGGESNLVTAMRQLRLDHDEEFGESEFEKIGSASFDGVKTETFIDSPEAKLAMKDKMEDVVVQAVKDETGVELESGSLEVTEEGKIILNGLPPSADAAKVTNFIESINKAMEADPKKDVLSEEDVLNDQESEENLVTKTANTLRGLLEELASYEQRTVRYFPQG